MFKINDWFHISVFFTSFSFSVLILIQDRVPDTYNPRIYYFNSDPSMVSPCNFSWRWMLISFNTHEWVSDAKGPQHINSGDQGIKLAVYGKSTPRPSTLDLEEFEYSNLSPHLSMLIIFLDHYWVPEIEWLLNLQ